MSKISTPVRRQHERNSTGAPAPAIQRRRPPLPSGYAPPDYLVAPVRLADGRVLHVNAHDLMEPRYKNIRNLNPDGTPVKGRAGLQARAVFDGATLLAPPWYGTEHRPEDDVAANGAASQMHQEADGDFAPLDPAEVVEKLFQQAERTGIPLTPQVAERLALGQPQVMRYVADLIARMGERPVVEPRQEGGRVIPGRNYLVNETASEQMMGNDGQVRPVSDGRPAVVQARRPGVILPGSAEGPRPPLGARRAADPRDLLASAAGLEPASSGAWGEQGASPAPTSNPPSRLLPYDAEGGIEGLNAPPLGHAFDRFGNPVMPNIRDFVMSHPDYKPERYAKVWSDDGRHTRPNPRTGTADPDPGELYDGSMKAYAPEGAVDPVTKKPLRPLDDLSNGYNLVYGKNPQTGRQDVVIIDPETGRQKREYFAMVTEPGHSNRPLVLPSGYYRSKTALRNGPGGSPQADMSPDAFPDSETERLLAWPYYKTIQTITGKNGRPEEQTRNAVPLRGQLGDLGFVVNNNTGQHYPAIVGDVRYNPRPEISARLYQETHPQPPAGTKRRPLPPGPRYNQYVFQGSGDGPQSWDPALAEERYALAERAALNNAAIQDAISAGYHRNYVAHPGMHFLPDEDVQGMSLGGDVSSWGASGSALDPSSRPEWQAAAVSASPGTFARMAGGDGRPVLQPWPGQTLPPALPQGAEQIPVRGGYERIQADGSLLPPPPARMPPAPRPRR